MNQEAIELLEKANEGTTLLPDRAYYRINPDKYNQALGILKQQPAEGEFTKECRSVLDMPPDDTHTYSAYVNDLEATLRITCDRLDTSESTNKDLLEVVKKAHKEGYEDGYVDGVETDGCVQNSIINQDDWAKAWNASDAKAKKEG